MSVSPWPVGKKKPGGVLADERGMALLITITVLTLLVAVTVEFHRKTWHKLQVSTNFRQAMRLKAVAMSGVNLGQSLLIDDRHAGEVDSLVESWATLDTDSFSGLFNGATLELTIEDMSGRLPLNSLVARAPSEQGGGNTAYASRLQEILLRLLLSGEFGVEDEVAARLIVDSLVDWIDEDDRESDYGVESGYYQSLEPAYECRNGPLRSVDELLLVRGISRELLYGSDNGQALADYVTIYGEDGKININTAPPLLIQSFDSLLDAEAVAAVDEYRRDEENMEALAQADWYKNVAEWPGDIVLDPDLLVTAGQYFRIIATAGHDTWSTTAEVDVQRSEQAELTLLARRMR